MGEPLMDALMAIVPVKPLAEAKTRLAGVLDEAERSALVRRLLERTLLKLSRASGLARVVVISRDETVLQIGRKFGAWSVTESDAQGTEPDLNTVLEQARRVCTANGAQAVLIVPVDLPHLRVRDLEKMIALGEPSPTIVIAPAARDGGTNALLLHPANAIAFHFGDKSFDKHVADAQANKIPIATYNSDTVTFDLDLPEDLALSKGLSF
jgi:2-phospho-L-lactate/phosphoenolpyruvate guanylyltransferase